MNQPNKILAGPEKVESELSPVSHSRVTDMHSGTKQIGGEKGSLVEKGPAAFCLWETRVMNGLGIRDREEMRSIRNEILTEDVDWALIKNRVMFTTGAVAKVEQHLSAVVSVGVAAIHFAKKTPPQTEGVHESPPSREQEQGEPIPQALHASFEAQAQVVEVVRNDLPNRHVLVCRIQGTNTLITVRGVKDSRKFLRGSATGLILAKPEPGSAAWLFAGNPNTKNGAVPHCPRFPGRW